MLHDKKGSVEFSLILFGLIFMTLLNISLGFVIDELYIESYDTYGTISEYVDEELDLGYFGGIFVTALLWCINMFFGLFGVNFIGAITLLPVWVVTLFTLLNTLVAFSVIMYMIDRFWIG